MVYKYNFTHFTQYIVDNRSLGGNWGVYINNNSACKIQKFFINDEDITIWIPTEAPEVLGKSTLFP